MALELVAPDTGVQEVQEFRSWKAESRNIQENVFSDTATGADQCLGLSKYLRNLGFNRAMIVTGGGFETQ